MTLPTDSKARKDIPLARGVLDYFPDALCEVADLSRRGNEQHNPGEPIHWAKEKSTDEADALMRHLIERGARDTDGARHSAKVAWRALALLQREIEAERDRDAMLADIAGYPSQYHYFLGRCSKAGNEYKIMTPDGDAVGIVHSAPVAQQIVGELNKQAGGE